MPRRRKESKPAEPRPNDDWVITTEIKVNGRIVTVGTELSIENETGRYRFVKHVYNPRVDAEWIDVVGGPKGYNIYRSFNPSRIKRVHWKNKTGYNLAEERKQARKNSKDSKVEK